MAMFEMRILPDEGEPFDLVAGMRDVRLWEKTHAKRSLGMLRDEGGVTATVLFEIAYTSCRRQGFIPDGMTEDEFTDAYEVDVETPEQRVARQRAEALKHRILTTPLPGEGDPTPDPVPLVEPAPYVEPFNGFAAGEVEQEEPDPLGFQSARSPELSSHWQ